MAFVDLQNAVTRVVGSQLSTTQIAQLINDAYQAVLNERQWFGLIKQLPLEARAPYTTGQISLASGSNAVTGTGTNWTSLYVGWYVLFQNQSPIRVSAVNSATSITLAATYNGASLTNAPYTLTMNRFKLPADAERVIRIASPQWNLVRVSSQFLDSLDPNRQQSGDPNAWCEVEVVSGIIECEFWPVPSEYKLHTLTYKPDPNLQVLVNGTDTVLLSQDLVTKKAQAEACRIMAARTAEGMWLNLEERYERQYASRFEEIVREDRRKRGTLNRALDGDDYPNWNDPAWASAWRLWSATSAQKLA